VLGRIRDLAVLEILAILAGLWESLSDVRCALGSGRPNRAP
jgi:hypothetical protein